MQNYQMLIDGEWVDASDGATFTSMNPYTGDDWAQFPEATESDVNSAVNAAHEAFTNGAWSKLTASQRGGYLHKLADLLAENSEKMGEIETRDTGKLFKETCFQAKYIAEFYRFFAGCCDKITGETLPIDKPDMFVFTRREPLGVVAAIIPWNSQIFLTAVKLGPALAAGNCIVIKASEQAPAPLVEFAKLVEQAGIPKGVVNIVTGHGDPCGRALTSHPLVQRISFTGGGPAAQHILQNSANNFAPVSLELGGKSPFIVFDDADLDSAVNGSISAIFGASGQSCVAGSRLLLHESIADEFLAKIIAQTGTIVIGDPSGDATEFGPLCTQSQLSKIQEQVAKAVAQGGKILCGGNTRPDLGPLFFEPTIIDCPNPDLDIVDTELFGPVLSVIRFKDEADALRLANHTQHGLAAGIFTKDGAKSIRMANAVKAGIVWVNTYRVVSPIAPFGGMKDSGYGRESGFQAMHDYTRPKTVWINTSSEPLASQFVMR